MLKDLNQKKNGRDILLIARLFASKVFKVSKNQAKIETCPRRSVNTSSFS